MLEVESQSESVTLQIICFVNQKLVDLNKNFNYYFISYLVIVPLRHQENLKLVFLVH